MWIGVRQTRLMVVNKLDERKMDTYFSRLDVGEPTRVGQVQLCPYIGEYFWASIVRTEEQ